ncbi:TPA: immunity protein Tsi6 family protein [Vibrio cholerae]
MSNIKVMTNEKKLLWVSEAKSLTENRIEKDPSRLNLYKVIFNQLEYVEKCIAGEVKTKSKLQDVNLGQLAVVEFEGRDDIYSNKLKDVYFIVHYMKKGLKVPELDNDGNVALN